MTVLGEVTCRNGYAGLIEIFRARFDQLGITGETADHVGGLAAGQTTKLFTKVTREHVKRFGPVTLGPILGVLGLKLTVEVDEEQFAQIRNRLTPAKFRRWHAGKPMHARKQARKSYHFSNRANAFKARQDQILTTTPAKRKRIAEHAAAVRWGLIRPETFVQELKALAKPNPRIKSGG